MFCRVAWRQPFKSSVRSALALSLADMTAQTASPASHPTTDNSKVWPAMVTGLVVLSGLQGNSKLSVVSGI